MDVFQQTNVGGLRIHSSYPSGNHEPVPNVRVLYPMPRRKSGLGLFLNVNPRRPVYDGFVYVPV